MDYLEAAGERLGARRRTEFELAVESVRAGTILAHDAKQYGRWRDGMKRLGPQAPPDPAARRAMVARLAMMFPGAVREAPPS